MSNNSHLSSSDEDGILLTNSVSTPSKPKISIKKTGAVVADPESETLVATAKKARKDEKSIKKPSTPVKRVAVVSPDEPSPKKGKSSGLFKKVWTNDDEITVLTELVKYMEGKGEFARSDNKGFHAFVKDALVGGFDYKQVKNKVRKLKDKYKKSSGKKNLTPHEEELMKLSKRVWGANSDSDGAGADADADDAGANAENDDVEDAKDADADDAENDDAEGAKDAKDDAKDADAKDDAEDAKDDDADAKDNETNNVCKTKKELKFIGKKSIAMGLVDANTVNAGLECCSDAVKVGIEEEWEQFHLEEVALFQKQLNLAIKETNCIVQALNK